MLLPALNQTRRETKTILCMTHHRELLVGVINYASDHNQMLPFTNWLSQDVSWRDQGGAGWLYRYPDSGYPGDWLPEHRESGSLWPYIGEETMYFCPLDVERDTGPTNAITSYMINGSISGYGSKLPVHRLESFEATDLFYWEVDETATPNYYNDGSSSPNELITRRHAGDLIIGTAGGHPERISWEDYQAELLARPGRFFNSPGRTGG